MVNSLGLSDNFLLAGQTAAWDGNGELINSIDSESEWILEINY